MDNPGPSRQRLPLDFSQSGYGSNTPHGPVSSSSTQFRRASCEFEHNTPMNMSNFYQRGSATVSYTSTRAAPPWTEVGEGTTPGDTYNPLVDFSQRLCSQRMPNRPRLEKGVSKSLDLGLNPGPSSTLSRRQSLDDTLDLTTLSHPYDPFKTDTDEKIPIQYSQMGQSYVNIESTSCRATALECSTQERYSTSLSACMYPQTRHSSTTGAIPFKFKRNDQQHQSNVEQVLGYGVNCQYTYTKMKTEPQDPSHPHVHGPDYLATRGHQELSINTSDIPGGSGFGTESTYDALYRQASRSEFGQGHSFDTRRKARTYHRLMATSSRDDPEDSASTMGSNKGASKQRRDQINNEIGTLRDLLPLPESARQRLSQLQIMSLSCVFIRKCNILQKLFNATPGTSSDSPCDFSQSLTGFLLVTTREGKLVYISENVTEYLGHSMVDMKTQGDSLFDIVDKRDHGTVRAQLLHGAGEVDPDKEVAFFCRMNMSRTLKRQAGFGDVKVMHVKGHFATVPGQEPGTEQQVFMALCSPLITPDIKESLIQNNTMVFKSVHQLDMNFIELTENGEYHLGVKNEDICSKSWYSYLHPEDIYEAREKHVQLIKSRHEMGCMMTVRMITASGEIIWVNIVMHVRQALLSNSDDPVILCINQVISEKEAYQFKVQGQLFALYAARSPDFFFGTAFCAPITPAMENVMSPSSGILPPPFFSRQQPFDNALTAQTAPYMQNPVAANQSTMFMKNGYQQNVGRQGHTDTLKALKRKIQENYTCKPPVKVPRMVNGLAHRNTFSPPQDTTPLPPSFENNLYRNTFGPHVGGGDHRGIGQGPMQVMYAHNLSTVMMSPKEKSYMPDVFSPKPMYEEKRLEQVVPDVSIPPCYLTPEPSPVSSPEPPKKCEPVRTVKETKLLDPLLIAKHLCALKQRQLNPNASMNPNGEPRKLLPSLDANYVDSFFHEIDNVSLTREEEILLLQNIAREKITIKEEPIEQEACKENHEPLTNDFDIEEFLQFTEKPIDETVQVKVESRSDDQQVMSFENSPSPSSPYSTISAADDKFNSDDFSSFALTPESGFESDSLDDVLETDCWDLESVKMDLSMTSRPPNLPAFRMTPDVHPEPELYQLKQLISSCTPSGMQDFTEDSQ